MSAEANRVVRRITEDVLEYIGEVEARSAANQKLLVNAERWIKELERAKRYTEMSTWRDVKSRVEERLFEDKVLVTRLKFFIR